MTNADSHPEQPWQRETVGLGLMLHAPAALVVDLQALRAQAADLAAAVTPDFPGRCDDGGGGWSRLILLQHYEATARPLPGLEHMPMALALAGRQGWQVQSIHLDRQAPGMGFPWHWDEQGLHKDVIRLLVPLCVPDGARTRIGHESIAYPPGQAWTGDFTLVHDVWNGGATDRISLVFDLAVTPEVVRMFPPALAAQPDLREVVARRTRDHLMQWWQAGGARRSYPAALRATG